MYRTTLLNASAVLLRKLHTYRAMRCFQVPTVHTWITKTLHGNQITKFLKLTANLSAPAVIAPSPGRRHHHLWKPSGNKSTYNRTAAWESTHRYVKFTSPNFKVMLPAGGQHGSSLISWRETPLPWKFGCNCFKGRVSTDIGNMELCARG